MSEYSVYSNGEYIHVYELDNCIKAIQRRNADNENKIKRLEEENIKLKEENFKDEEIQKMQKCLEKMKEDYYRGFPITEEEEVAIEKWKKKHDKKSHSLVSDRIEGCIGGRYSYYFVPTSIGCSGVIKCQCGAEFEFKKIW